MTTITILGVPISVHVRKTLVALTHKGIEHRVEPVVPFDPPPDWAALSPTGLIPVMRDADFTLPDSSAICQYLERKQATPPILPADPEAFARALWFDAYAGNLFRDVVHGLFFEKVIGPAMLDRATDLAAVDRIQDQVVPKYFGYLDSQAVGPFLVGEALTLADIAIASNLINYRYLGLGIDPAEYPRLAAYARDIVAQPAFRTALAGERPFAEQMGLDRSFVA
jgi:glutathione S-transferase